ncbi:amino acid permease [Singulisphaera sp. PoT]|uniref:amino acid permease n=1 Tax=Singulisphaera sp. PoT TaxID=3411797 RepID=UPI003BF52730
MKRMMSSFFTKKPIDTLIHEMSGEERLHRALGPISLTSLGVGATIGAGIYVLTGEVARNFAGPAIILSFLFAGIGCGLAALCYSEMASMVPVAGSAYTYAYATLGELFAWIIGWDLVLEYAIGSAAVANGWSNYFVEFTRHLLHIEIDPRLLAAPWDFSFQTGASWNRVQLASGEIVNAWFNLPAVLITVLVTWILVVGIRESAGFNAAMVILNVGIILTIIGVGAAYVDPSNWKPFVHEEKGWRGVFEGASRVFFAYIGFDSISTHAEEARNPQRDLALGIIAALLICTTLYIGVSAVITGMVPYGSIDVKAPLAAAFRHKGLTFANGLISVGILAGLTSSLLVANLSQPRILMAMARDGMLPESFFGDVHPKYKTPWKSTILVGVIVALGASLIPLNFLADLVSVGTLFAFVIVCVAVLILRYTNPDIKRPFRVPALPLVAGLGIAVNGGLMFMLGRDNWIRLIVWLAVGLVIYLAYSRRHTKFGKPASPIAADDLA